MSLSDYKMYPKASLVQKLPEIGGILFGDMPEPIEKAFHPGGEGGFTYRSAVGFKLLSDFPETESEAVGVWNVFRVRKEKKISAYFGKGVAPVLFPAGLTLRSAEKVPVKNASALPTSWDRIEGFYWVLTYDLVLNVLRLKQNLASLAATHLLGYESPFSQEDITPVLNTFLKKAEKQSFKGVVKGASLKVYVSGNHIIGMDYSLPVMEYGKPSELLKIPDRIQYSGSQSISEVEDVPDFYFRVQEGLVVPFYMDGVAACREGVVREEEEINGGGIRFPTQLFRNSSWVYMIYPLLTEIPRWKKFTRLVDSQANIDLLIFLTNGEVYWNLWDKENSYLDGERGVTYFVENIQDFKKQQLEEDNLKDVQEKYLDSSFQKDKKCVLVGLASDMFRQIEITKTDILDKKISINQIEQLCISILNTILHECLAHATDYIVNGKNTTTVFQEHESYSGAKSVSTYSDKTYFQNTALHNTSEYKTLIEIKGVVEWFFKDTDFLVEMINDLE